MSVTVAPLDLPNMTDACYGLTVFNTTDPLAFGAETQVWTQPELCASQYGANGGIRFTGICDAQAAGEAHDNAVRLVLNDVYSGGDHTTGAALAAGTDYVNPCPAPTEGQPDNGCILTAPCTENQDSKLVFNLTVMRNAQLGFFDTVVKFQDIFCSAKLDCVEDDGQTTLTYLPIPGTTPSQDGPTAVLAFACTGGAGSPDPYLYLNNPVVTCRDGDGNVTRTAEVDVSAGPGHVAPTQTGSPDVLFAAAVNRGDGFNGSAYWNVLLGLGLNGVSGEVCTLTTKGTASETPLVDFTTPDGTRYPIIEWNVDLSNGSDRVCTRHPLNASNGDVATTYTPVSAPEAFAFAMQRSTNGTVIPADTSPKIRVTGLPLVTTTGSSHIANIAVTDYRGVVLTDFYGPLRVTSTDPNVGEDAVYVYAGVATYTPNLTTLQLTTLTFSYVPEWSNYEPFATKPPSPTQATVELVSDAPTSAPEVAPLAGTLLTNARDLVAGTDANFVVATDSTRTERLYRVQGDLAELVPDLDRVFGIFSANGSVFVDAQVGDQRGLYSDRSGSWAPVVDSAGKPISELSSGENFNDGTIYARTLGGWTYFIACRRENPPSYGCMTRLFKTDGTTVDFIDVNASVGNAAVNLDRVDSNGSDRILAFGRGNAKWFFFGFDASGTQTAAVTLNLGTNPNSWHSIGVAGGLFVTNDQWGGNKLALFDGNTAKLVPPPSGKNWAAGDYNSLWGQSVIAAGKALLAVGTYPDDYNRWYYFDGTTTAYFSPGVLQPSAPFAIGADIYAATTFNNIGGLYRVTSATTGQFVNGCPLAFELRGDAYCVEVTNGHFYRVVSATHPLGDTGVVGPIGNDQQGYMRTIDGWRYHHAQVNGKWHMFRFDGTQSVQVTNVRPEGEVVLNPLTINGRYSKVNNTFWAIPSGTDTYFIAPWGFGSSDSFHTLGLTADGVTSKVTFPVGTGLVYAGPIDKLWVTPAGVIYPGADPAMIGYSQQQLVTASGNHPLSGECLGSYVPTTSTRPNATESVVVDGATYFMTSTYCMSGGSQNRLMRISGGVVEEIPAARGIYTSNSTRISAWNGGVVYWGQTSLNYQTVGWTDGTTTWNLHDDTNGDNTPDLPTGAEGCAQVMGAPVVIGARLAFVCSENDNHYAWYTNDGSGFTRVAQTFDNVGDDFVAVDGGIILGATAAGAQRRAYYFDGVAMTEICANVPTAMGPNDSLWLDGGTVGLFGVRDGDGGVYLKVIPSTNWNPALVRFDMATHACTALPIPYADQSSYFYPSQSAAFFGDELVLNGSFEWGGSPIAWDGLGWSQLSDPGEPSNDWNRFVQTASTLYFSARPLNNYWDERLFSYDGIHSKSVTAPGVYRTGQSYVPNEIDGEPYWASYDGNIYRVHNNLVMKLAEHISGLSPDLVAWSPSDRKLYYVTYSGELDHLQIRQLWSIDVPATP